MYARLSSFVSYLHRRTTDTRVGVIVVPLVVVVGPVSRRVGRVVVDMGNGGWVSESVASVRDAQLPLFFCLPSFFINSSFLVLLRFLCVLSTGFRDIGFRKREIVNILAKNVNYV